MRNFIYFYGSYINANQIMYIKFDDERFIIFITMTNEFEFNVRYETREEYRREVLKLEHAFECYCD